MLNVMQIGYGYWGTNVAQKIYASEKLKLRYLAESDMGRRRVSPPCHVKSTSGVVCASRYERMKRSRVASVIDVWRRAVSRG